MNTFDKILSEINNLILDHLPSSIRAEFFQQEAQLRATIIELTEELRTLKEQNQAYQNEIYELHEKIDALFKDHDIPLSDFKLQFANDVSAIFLKYLNKVIDKETEITIAKIEEAKRIKEANDNWTDPHTEAFKNCPDKDCYPN